MLKHSGRLLSLLLVAALCVLAQAPAVAQDAFKDAKKEFEAARKDNSPTRMGRAIEQMASAQTPEARDYLLDLLADDQKERKAKRPGFPGEVRKKLVMALSVFTDDASVAKIGEAVLKIDSIKDPVSALDQFDFFLALARMKESKAAQTVIESALGVTKPPNPFIKCAALEAIRQAGDSRFAAAVTAILKEDNKEWWTKWKVVPINVFACLQVIAQTDDNDAAVNAVEATADLAKMWEDDKIVADERVRYFAGRMLKALTGENADIQSWQFWKWWALQRKALGRAPKVEKDAPKKREQTKAASPIFNAAPVGTRFVFCIDVSDSMKMPVKIDLPEIEKRPPEPPKSGNLKKDGDPEEQKRREEEDKRIADEEHKRGIDTLKKLPWKTITNKIELAREEMARAIEALPDNFQFAIITYSTDVDCVTGGFVKSDASSRSKWGKLARELEPEKLTNIHGGLMASMRLGSGNYKPGLPVEPSIDADCMINGADTIIFLTDGWGSWSDDSTAQTTEDPRGGGGRIGNGTHILGPEIWPDIYRHNLFRKVVINTVGIGNHDKECLKHIAKDSGGTYVDWSFPE